MNDSKVLHLSHLRHNSAITEYLVSLYHILKNRKKQFVVLPQGSEACDRLTREGLAPEARGSGFWTKLYQLVFVSYSHVIVYGGSDFWPAALVKVLCFKKYKLIRVRGQAIFGRTAAKIWLLNFAERFVDLTLVPSQFLYDDLQKVGFAVHKSQVVSIGIASEKFCPSEELSAENIVIVGRFDPKKGYDFALQCFAEIKRQQQDFNAKLVIIGKPTKISYQEMCGQIAKHSLKLEKDVVVHSGHVDDLRERIRRAVIGWVPSLDSEYIARVSYEFLLSGVPIIVNSIGSLTETVKSFDSAGETYQHDRESIEEIASRVYQLYCKSAEESLEQKKQRASLARECFSRSRMQKEIDAIIQ